MFKKLLVITIKNQINCFFFAKKKFNPNHIKWKVKDNFFFIKRGSVILVVPANLFVWSECLLLKFWKTLG